MDKQKLFPRVVLAILAVFCFAFIFWMAGGLHWMETKVFPPKRPAFMPPNSVWIDAPPLPLSWHHGWWLGCESSSRQTTSCKLVLDRRTVFASDYASCQTGRAVPEANLTIVPPKDSAEMWLFGEDVDGVAVFTASGDVLLPTTALSKCPAVLARLQKTKR